MGDIFDNKAISPMLLHEIKEPFDDEEYIFELKLDGIRCLAYIDKNVVTLRNKRDKDVTDIYPELSDIYKCAKNKCILDGELVVFIDGKPDFYALQKRSLMTNDVKIKLASRKLRAEYVAYDILYLGDKDITYKSLLERKEILKNNIAEGYGLSVSRYIAERGIDFFNLAKERELEGIVAKNINGKYHIGKRTRDWVKIKVMQEEDLLICGFQKDDKGQPKDVILAERHKNNKLAYRGKVYLGFSKEDKQILIDFSAENTVAPLFDVPGDIVWIEPKYIGVVRYMHLTADGAMRQPVLKELSTNKNN